jgi:hypothetical protein
MKKITTIIILLILFGCSSQSVVEGLIDWESGDKYRAEQVVHALIIGEYASVRENFNSAMKNALNLKKLREAWESVAAEAGEFINFVNVEELPSEEYDIYLVTTRHEHMGVVTRVVFDINNDLITGLHMRFAEIYDVIHDGTPEVRNGFTEFYVVVGEGTEYPLNGLLSIPENTKELVPGVVLVHGSGPLDMNETAFGITFFKDVAEYLARHGIAVLRYDKRTFAHGMKLAENYGDTLTVWQEVIEDALLAKEILEQHEAVDASRVFILGHSLGGMLAPRIVHHGDFAGGIIMAGSPRSLLDIMYDQAVYFYELMDISEEEKAKLYSEADTALAEAAETYYFQEMDLYSTEFYLTADGKPYFILQGDKDIQVYADRDFAMYQQIARGHENHITLKLYDGLTHFFTRSVMEEPTLEDYIPGSKVEEEPLQDIVQWINNH